MVWLWRDFTIFSEKKRSENILIERDTFENVKSIIASLWFFPHGHKKKKYCQQMMNQIDWKDINYLQLIIMTLSWIYFLFQLFYLLEFSVKMIQCFSYHNIYFKGSSRTEMFLQLIFKIWSNPISFPVFNLKIANVPIQLLINNFYYRKNAIPYHLDIAQ